MELIKIAVDGMGGDFAPEQICKGSVEAVTKYDNIELTIYGDVGTLKKLLPTHPRIKVVDTPYFLDMGIEDPLSEYRRNKKHSMFMAMDAVSKGEADAVVSAGPTQALIVGSHFIVKRMKGMRKLGIAPVFPSAEGNPKILIDAGANLDLKPEHLESFALFGSLILQEVYEVDKPKVGLINIGTEPAKGRELERETYELLEQNNYINFAGNIEPKEVLDNTADVLISDGFTANIVMKTMEGTIRGLAKILKRELTKTFIRKLATGLFLRGAIKDFRKQLDPNEIGGAMIIGAAKPVVKAHGSSNAFAFSNAIRQAKLLVEKDVLNKVSSQLGSVMDE